MTTSPEVPGTYPVALDGMPFMLDLSADGGGFIAQSVPVLRTQSDQGARPGEQSLSPEDLWRRSVESWHHGAGQDHADREDSDPYRFRSSLHIDPWTKYEISLLPTVATTVTASDYAELCVTGLALFLNQDTDVVYTTDIPLDGLPIFTTVTGLPVHTYSMASDGHTVYTVHGTDDIYATGPAGVGSSLITNASADLRLIRYAKGRILAFDNVGSVYNPVSIGALPAALYTHPMAANFVWTDATEGESNIYMSGYSGTGSEAHGVIYRTAIKQDGTALDIPIIAARLPDGEQALSVCGYLGLLFVGTSLGVRTCLERDDGSLVVGPLIETGPCYCFEPQGSQVWFGWDDFDDFAMFDTTNNGLGRIDLSDFEFGKGAPAYATDLMRAGAGTLTRSAATFQNKRCWASADGFTAETISLNESGYMAGGFFNYALTETKVWHYLKVRTTTDATKIIPYVNSIDVLASLQHGIPVASMALGSSTDGTDEDSTVVTVPATFELGGRRAEQLEYALQIFGTTNRVTLLARPAVASRAEMITMTVLLNESLDIEGLDDDLDVATRMQRIRSMVRSAAPVDLQDGTDTYKVTVEDYRYVRAARSEQVLGRWNGPCQIQMKRNDTVSVAFRFENSDSGVGATFSVPVPDGALSGDLLFAAAAWVGAAGTPTVAGWTLLDSHTDTNYKTATWWRAGMFGDFDAVFSGAVTYVAAVAAYSQGEAIVMKSTVHGTTPGSNVKQLEDFTINAVAAITATVWSTPHSTASGFGISGAARARLREVYSNVAGRDLYLELGDAVTVSTFKATEELAPTVPCAVGDIIDALISEIRYVDEVRVMFNYIQ